MKFENKPGIYQIFNLKNGKCCIGQSLKLSTRIQSHKKMLKTNTHPNRHLQASYNKHGIEAFEYRVVMYLPKEHLTQAEQYWIDYYRESGEIYNLSKVALPTLSEIQLINKRKAANPKYESRKEYISAKNKRRIKRLNEKGITAHGKPYKTPEELAISRKNGKCGEAAVWFGKGKAIARKAEIIEESTGICLEFDSITDAAIYLKIGRTTAFRCSRDGKARFGFYIQVVEQH